MVPWCFYFDLLPGNTYVDFFLLALAELPSAAVEASLIDSLGRVALMGGGLVLSTLVCLAGALLTRWSGIQVGVVVGGGGQVQQVQDRTQDGLTAASNALVILAHISPGARAQMHIPASSSASKQT
jgi:hypothetical protein